MNKMHSLPNLAWALAITQSLTPAFAAPISMTGAGNYSQNFNTLTTSTNPTTGTPWADDSTIPFWYADYGGRTLGFYFGATGNLFTKNFYSFGVEGINPVTDRALGSITGSGNSDIYTYGVQLENSAGGPITINSLTYTGEQWRNAGKVATDKISFSYQISSSLIEDVDGSDLLPEDWVPIPAFDFTTLIGTTSSSALDGNAVNHRTMISGNPSLVLEDGEFIMLRWTDENDSGPDHGMGIDDVSLAWEPIVPPDLSVSASPASFVENEGQAASTGTITIPAAIGTNLEVTVYSDIATSASVPATVTIPAGQVSVTFPINAVDDEDPENPTMPLITVSTDGYSQASTTITVYDDADLPPTLNPGAIAIIGFNAFSKDDLVFATLAPITQNDIIYFTNKTWNGGDLLVDGRFLGTFGGSVRWTPPAGGIAQGSVVTLFNLNNSERSANLGTVELITGSLDIQPNNGVITAFQGSSTYPTGFLAAFTNGGGDFTGSGLLANGIIEFPPGTSAAVYTGPRDSEVSFAGYLPLIDTVVPRWNTAALITDITNINTSPFVLISSDFTEWAHATGVTSGIDDYDGDGRSNFYEYSFGLDPLSASSFEPITVPLDKGTGTFSYTRRTQSLSGLSYQVFTSTSLITGSWAIDTQATVEVSSLANGIETVTVTLSAPAPLTAPKLFVRVVVR
ncbi:hypothetical protein N9192_00515 [Akkermansiaceae bacterium]|nr:hypothetical protein [Akkermansiaceae bacterium]